MICVLKRIAFLINKSDKSITNYQVLIYLTGISNAIKNKNLMDIINARI